MSRITVSTKTKASNYTLVLDSSTLKLLSGVNELFNNSQSTTKVSNSLLVRKAIRDYTGKLLTSNDPKVIENELASIKALK